MSILNVANFDVLGRSSVDHGQPNYGVLEGNIQQADFAPQVRKFEFISSNKNKN